MTGILTSKAKDIEEKGHVEMEAETGVMPPQAKEHQEPPEAGKGKEGSFPRVCRGWVALLPP